MQYVTSMAVKSQRKRMTNRLESLRVRSLAVGFALIAALLAGCSGGSGADVQVIPGSGGGPTTQNYTGPAPATADVQSFKINLWDNIQADNRCGTCHSDTGGQTPMFARRDDVNLAYAAANSVVDLVVAEGLDDGGEGRRRSQLLAREQRRLRRHSYHLDHELGRHGQR